MAIWQQVVNRKKTKTVFDRMGPIDRPWQQGNNLEAVSKVSTSVYVTNFPSYLSSVDLKRLCVQFGVVTDVFISKKLSKVGKHFGFVRFIRVSDVHVLISNLCSIWVGSFKMFASKARFDRTANSPKPYSKIPAMSKPDIPEEKKRSRNLHFSNGGEPLSYASAVMGKTRRSEVVRPSEEILNLTVGDFVVEKDEQKRFLLGRVNDFHILPCLDAMCKSEGFLQIEFRYVGGLWVLIEFISDIAAQNFKNNKVVDSWFKEILQWNRDFVCSERLVWIDIEGVPLKAWSKGNFKKIINK